MLVVVGGANLKVKSLSEDVPLSLNVHLVVHHLGGLGAHGPHHLVAGLVCLNTDAVPGRLCLTVLIISNQFNAPRYHEIHSCCSFGAEVSIVLETVHNT